MKKKDVVFPMDSCNIQLKHRKQKELVGNVTSFHYTNVNFVALTLLESQA